MSVKPTDEFFQERKDQSQIKASIVSKYFYVWSKIIAPRVEELMYVDLFSGPGVYEDGSRSTPLMIVESALRNAEISNKIRFVFNDENFEYINQLQVEIEQLEGYENLKHAPVFLNKDVSEIRVEDIYPGRQFRATLLFVDPFGYNGLSLGFFNILRLWGSDIIFFFNYKRINMAVNNRVFVENMKRLFGEEIFLELRETFQEKLTPVKREAIITDAISRKLQVIEPEILKPLHYRFRNQTGNRTTHHLFFATKNPAGYKSMKDIMANQSSEIQEGVAQMEYNPETHLRPRLLLDFSIPMLKQDLLVKFPGQTKTVQQVFYEDNIGRPYTEKNYKEALRQLEDEGRIIASPAKGLRPARKGIVTMADSVRITFP